MIFKRIGMYLKFLRSLFHLNIGVLFGMWKLTKLPQPIITIFGGSRLPIDSHYAKIIYKISQKLAAEGYSILTGGGPGIMAAANLGATEYANGNGNHHKKTISMGIGVVRLESYNKYAQDFISQPYFFTRKWLLVRNSVGFIVGPGGFGTMDELSEVLTLLQTHHMQKTPVVIIGKEYWEPMIDWVKNKALKNDLITLKDVDLISITDDPDEAVQIIKNFCLTSEATPGYCALPNKNVMK
ncbi:TPA: TIGR00730 family Rossman fold protein [Candidatus Dependentiae bacterium]|nr:MAG: Rossmann fold nucleotide-binding protein-like protein [candidate division TM6 bacterium GW2011_GWE2_31_21]KKP53764.1 MAG: Rossmann fold nucleotide-binding protein-like protein [candidate division TM6 bacterium GW2011_GWF2_33_332]HBS48482.1 TIGR00730 family Rossman fold protein [Candidatus Dependentiae bacterium]HBZ73097.1 TIGR00730 family Rossman fold protein [Candidatus Dependentiae bacterium]